MKKNLKKIIISSSIFSVSVLSSVSIIQANYLKDNLSKIIDKSVNSNSQKTKSIIFNGKTYGSIEEAILEYEKNNASTETYIGDFYKESSSGYNYRKIYLDKNEVHKFDNSKIKPAYSTSYGKSTMDANVSKKSYVEQPINAYKDIYGNVYYTEKEAINSSAKSITFGSASYYELTDYSKTNSNNSNEVKINPINKNDLLALKKLALWNIGRNNSPFEINYYYANETPYNGGSTRYEIPKNPGDYISLDKNLSYTKDKIFYAITFNGVPLFKFDQNWISDNFFTNKYFDISENRFIGGNMPEGMKQNPSQYISNFIKEKLEKWKANDIFVDINFFDKLCNNISNVSNNLKFDENKNWYLEKKYGVPFDRSETTIGFTTKEIESSSHQDLKNKFIDESKFSMFGVTNDQLQSILKVNKSDDESLLMNDAGVLKTIYDYNKSLKSFIESSKIPTEIVTNNMVTDPKDMVFLFNRDKSNFKVKYSEYPTYNINFNNALSEKEPFLIKSIEEKNEFITKNTANSVQTIWMVYDKRGGLLSESVDRQVAFENAINASKPEVDLDFVYYEKNSKYLKIKNQISELNVLKVDNEYYGFATYQELQNYLYEYIKMSSTDNGGGNENVKPPVHETSPFEPSDIVPSNFSKILSTFPSLDVVNKLSVEEKFNKFGSEFKISSIEDWNKFIGNGLNFIEKAKENKRLSFNNIKDSSLQEVKIANMIVTLQNGHKFSNGQSTFTQEISYVPNLSTLPEDSLSGKNTYSSKNDIIISVSTAIAIVVILEVIVLTIMMINKKKNEDNSLKILNEYYKNNK